MSEATCKTCPWWSRLTALGIDAPKVRSFEETRAERETETWALRRNADAALAELVGIIEGGYYTDQRDDLVKRLDAMEAELASLREASCPSCGDLHERLQQAEAERDAALEEVAQYVTLTDRLSRKLDESDAMLRLAFDLLFGGCDLGGKFEDWLADLRQRVKEARDD